MSTSPQTHRHNYYSFGSSLKTRSYSVGSGFRFGFNGMEQDGDITNTTYPCYYSYYRVLDVNNSKWFSSDPLAQFVFSQYSSFMNNPINKIDPEGGWIPSMKIEKSSEKDGPNQIAVLVAQKENGDNEKTLATFLNISAEESAKLFKSIDNNGYVRVPLKIAQPINKAVQHSLDNPSDYGGYLDKNYNCFASAIFTSQGEFPLEKSYINEDFSSGYDFVQKILSDDFENVSEQPQRIKFGRTIIRLGKNVNEYYIFNYNVSIHACIFLGKSRNGTVYVFTKNGWSESPQISTLQQTLNIYPDSIIQGAGPKKNEGGYYNFIGPGGF